MVVNGVVDGTAVVVEDNGVVVSAVSSIDCC